MHALWDLSQPRAGHFVHLPHVPCSEVLSRPCYAIIAQAKAEASPITRRQAARRVCSCSCRIKTAFWGVT
ncbi:unnamed protein product [Pelagomonas calceolata]|uniref:Uncharacterized protein n=1 Tax=Pelagomonas calceolata TaxID=35677 RepID=A0A8J2SY51_9STRA|nr:unnamed protein product [Pelagomonas calceolata]